MKPFSNTRYFFAAVIGFWCIVLCIVSCGTSALAAPNLAVRVKVTGISGKAPEATQKFKLTWGEVREFTGGNWSEWATFAGYNGEGLLDSFATVEPAPPIEPFPRLKLEVETAVEGGEKSANRAELFGPRLRLVAWKEGDRIHVDTNAGHVSRVYGPLFKAAEIPVKERPRRILFGDRYILGVWDDNNLESWRTGVGGLAGLGINTISPEGSGGQPAIREAMLDAGISKVWNAVYNPPGYAFNFDGLRYKIFADFVKKQVDPILAMGWKPEEIGYWVTSDEPGWYYPSQYNTFNKELLAVGTFYQYLKANGQTPETLGKPSWGQVRFIGRRQYNDLPSRRLFYWSNRFASWASARFFAEVTRNYEQAIRPGVPVMVNFNNFMGLFYSPGLSGNNPDRQNGNAAMGQHDWLEFGRERGTTAIATEDWFGDWAADNWSFYATRLRSAAELSGDPKVGFGGLIIPRVSGEPAGMSKKIMALVGNGAKTVEFFIYGPEYAFPGNCWSENQTVYKELSAGTRMVGKAEDLLFPGKTRRPEVALLTPQSSQLWDLEEQEIANGLSEATNTNLIAGRMEYTAEMFCLYHALQRAAIPANFVDEKGLTEPSLKSYKVLYVTAPDIPKESIDGLLDWVRAGGILVTLPGAGQNDRYHQPLNTLNEATGIAPEKAMRELADWNNANPNGTFEVNGQKLTIYGRREPLKVTDAKATSVLGDGTPVVTWKAVGKGRIMHFAFLPGLSYFRATAQQGIPNRLYAGGGMRDLIASPVRAAKVALPVTVSQPVIEAPALYSDGGVAVTLLNYGEEGKHAATQNIEISVAVDKPVKRVESVNVGKLLFREQNGRAIVSLPFADVDVVKLYY